MADALIPFIDSSGGGNPLVIKTQSVSFQNNTIYSKDHGGGQLSLVGWYINIRSIPENLNTFAISCKITSGSMNYTVTQSSGGQYKVNATAIFGIVNTRTDVAGVFSNSINPKAYGAKSFYNITHSVSGTSTYQTNFAGQTLFSWIDPASIYFNPDLYNAPLTSMGVGLAFVHSAQSNFGSAYLTIRIATTPVSGTITFYSLDSV